MIIVPVVVAATGVDVRDMPFELDNTKWPNISNGVFNFRILEPPYAVVVCQTFCVGVNLFRRSSPAL